MPFIEKRYPFYIPFIEKAAPFTYLLLLLILTKKDIEAILQNADGKMKK